MTDEQTSYSMIDPTGCDVPRTLDELPMGASAVITSVDCDSNQLRQHIFDMGLTPGVRVTVQKEAPLGDPIQLCLRGYELTIRKADAAQISIGDVDENPGDREEPVAKMNTSDPVLASETLHPSFGEEDVNGALRDGADERYRPRPGEHAIPANRPINFALVGNQNAGKTTLFNALTGSNQHVGNFPGVTVDRKDGTIRNHPEATVTDLPGIYSLSPYTSEEIVSRQFVLDEKPDAIIDIVDGTNIERNLYLSLQLMELDVPLVIALNMMDEVVANGGSIDVNVLEAELGVPVVPISAANDQGIDELVEHALVTARKQLRPGRVDFCEPDGPDGGAAHRCIHGVMHLIEDHALRADLPLRFAATKLIEGDPLVTEALALDANELDAVEHIVAQMESETGVDRMAAISDMRFTFIERTCAKCVWRPRMSREHERSLKADRILTGKYTAIPMFILIMAVVFWLTFNVVGQPLSDLLGEGIEWLTQAVRDGFDSLEVNPLVISLVCDGVFPGVGTVLSFLPIIVVLFLLLSALEDTGYMARVAFFMDKLLRKLGLSGRSFVPLIMGFGCSVPAIMATRTLPSEHDRRMTIMLVPFMSCSAKLPVYALLCGFFFAQYAALAMLSLYLLGIVVGILAAVVLSRTVFRGDPVPFVMELPNYRLPSVGTVCRLAWDKAKEFAKKAFTVVFVATIIIWFLQTFDVRFNVVTDQTQSMLAGISTVFAPIFAPLGFGDWRAATAVLTGFMAKENVISTITQLVGGNLALLTTIFTPLAAYSFLVFVLLYTPCIMSIITVKGELGGKYAAAIVVVQCVIAWLVAFVVHGIGLLLGL